MNINFLIKNEEIRVKKHGIASVPFHYVIDIQEESKRIEFLEEFSYSLFLNKLRKFHGLDLFLYYSLDGSIRQIEDLESLIDTAAVYDNYFEGVLAFGIDKLLLHTNRLSREMFLQLLENTKDNTNATISLFVDDLSDKATKDFLSDCDKWIDFKIVGYTKIR